MDFRQFVLILIVLSFYVSPMEAQRRTNIYDFTSAERAELRDLILDYACFERHGNDSLIYRHHVIFNSPEYHNYDEYFLIWHRNYIAGMENYFLELGYPQYVPLPYWSPVLSEGEPWQGVNDGYVPLEYFDDVENKLYACTGPGHEMADFINTTVDPIPYNSDTLAMDFSRFYDGSYCTAYDTMPYQFCPEVVFQSNDAPSLPDYQRIADQFSGDFECEHNKVHAGIGGLMRTHNSPAAAIFWPWHAWCDDVYYFYQRDCQSNYRSPDLWIGDSANDIGDEGCSLPAISNVDNTDIWFRKNNDGYLLANRVNETVPNGEQTPFYVYVKVRNRGGRPNEKNIGQLNLYWANEMDDLLWDGAGIVSSSMNNCTANVGGLLSSQALMSTMNYTAINSWNGPQYEPYSIYEFEINQGIISSLDAFANCNNPTSFYLLAQIENAEDDAILCNTNNIPLNEYVGRNNNVAIHKFEMEEGIVSVNELELNVNIFPNPVHNEIRISGMDEAVNITLFNLQGIKILEKINTTENVLDVKGIDMGIYFITISDANNISTTKKIFIAN